ncbi:TRAP transporter small permease [Acidimangrovimonas pyrenivorans]|uniref:TRAP transporter small permease protein n=1 Tax=Acidimangrovimonas pyrenivorans TaxID=2030798 RepID=A0ABV7AJ77_9RHOB
MMAYIVVAALLIGDVLAREVVGIPILGSQSIAVLGAIVAGFVGLSLATASGSHLRPAVFDGLVPSSLDRYVDRGSDLIAAAFYLAIAVFAVRFVLESMSAGDRAAVLYFPLWPIQMVMPYAFLSCAIRHAAYAMEPALKVHHEAAA